MFPLRDIAGRDLDPETGQRERNRLRTRAALNTAAVRLFAQHGYDTTSVDDICTEAGVSVRTFFRYFSGKEDVLFARQMEIGPFVSGLATQDPDIPALEAVRRAYLEQPRLTPEEVEVTALFHQGMGSSPVLQGRYVEGLRYFRGEVARALAARQGRDTPDDADVLAAVVAQSTLDHAYTRWIERGSRGDLRKAVETAFAMLDNLTAAGPTAPSAPRAARITRV